MGSKSAKSASKLCVLFFFFLPRCHCFSKTATPVTSGSRTNKSVESESWDEFVTLNGVVKACLPRTNFLFLTSPYTKNEELLLLIGPGSTQATPCLRDGSKFKEFIWSDLMGKITRNVCLLFWELKAQPTQATDLQPGAFLWPALPSDLLGATVGESREANRGCCVIHIL